MSPLRYVAELATHISAQLSGDLSGVLAIHPKT